MKHDSAQFPSHGVLKSQAPALSRPKPTAAAALLLATLLSVPFMVLAVVQLSL
ncbi:hypothetical protein J7443_04245 [Tropicibacter sp. R15_0]|uniref:hypothetical protein n=1 Tax=Tropicibacter sp. R15_0 TaxID=2821101 RepID=UPI001ADB2AA2|nr:hypothetical protein [Tropicibacter sp. R15_0]MBO9464432.1 hypothetical protein [Tropicibacter sp. R15_0]